MGKPDYDTTPYPRVRHATRELLHAAARKPMIHSIVEVDIHDLRSELRTVRRDSGRAPSITSCVIAATARAVESNRVIHGYRDLRNRLVLFHDVDVSVPIERIVDGVSQVIPTIVRRANVKSAAAIDDEIWSASKSPVDGTALSRSIDRFAALPRIVRRIAFRLLDRIPVLMKRAAGTVMVTSVGMFGSGAGWGIPVASHTANVTIGGIVVRPRLNERGAIDQRDHLCLTVSFDHDIVDGAPAARFVHRLRRSLERPDGIPIS